MTAIPVLDTARLTLRAHRADDLDAYAALWQDAEVVRFIGGKPIPRADCWTRILRFRGMWEMLGYGFWIIADKATGTLIGEAGVMDSKRDLTPSLDGTLEAGWVLLPSQHGRGLAREAMEAVLAWADANRPGIAQSCIIGEGNAASIGLAEKLGFMEYARSEMNGAALIQYRRQTTSTAG